MLVLNVSLSNDSDTYPKVKERKKQTRFTVTALFTKPRAAGLNNLQRPSAVSCIHGLWVFFHSIGITPV